MKTVWALLILVSLTAPATAQKVKIGYDKSVDFTRYHTFSWPDAADAPELTLKRATVMAYIEEGLNAKGLVRVDKGGDLLLSGSGGFGGQQAGEVTGVIIPAYTGPYNPMSTGWVGTPVAMGSAVISGTLVVQMVDQSAGRLVWQGMVTQRVDMDNKPKTIERIRIAIEKLMAQYPPKK